MVANEADPLVVLRPEGLYCPLGDFYIDPWEPVATAVITHCHGDHLRAGAQRYWLNHEAIPLATIRIGAASPLTGLAYGETVKMGGVWLSLHPAGRLRWRHDKPMREADGLETLRSLLRGLSYEPS